MKALIVVESYFGNTLKVAEILAAALAPHAATVLTVPESPSEIPLEVDLLLVGAPTHDFSMPNNNTRGQAHAKGGEANEFGVREWIADLRPRAVPVRTFDTSFERMLSGSAARSAARAMGKRGFREVERGPSFHVQGRSGPLNDGEVERVHGWAAELVREFG